MVLRCFRHHSNYLCKGAILLIREKVEGLPMKKGEQLMSIARLSSYDLQKVIETITITAIAANTNFFIILSFLIVNIYFYYFLSLWIHWRTHSLYSQSACQKNTKIQCLLIIRKLDYLYQKLVLWKQGKSCGNIPQKTGELLKKVMHP